jgi:hypothetical protein
MRCADEAGFNSCEVGPIVAVKIGNRKVRCGSAVREGGYSLRAQPGAARAEAKNRAAGEQNEPLARAHGARLVFSVSRNYRVEKRTNHDSRFAAIVGTADGPASIATV